MALTLCTQPDLAGNGIEAARCIDGRRLSRIANSEIAAREKGNRPGCLCAESRDIGAYDSCVQGCAYCYAVRSPAAALQRRRRHDPAGEMLSPAGARALRPRPRGSRIQPAVNGGQRLDRMLGQDLQFELILSQRDTLQYEKRC